MFRFIPFLDGKALSLASRPLMGISINSDTLYRAQFTGAPLRKQLWKIGKLFLSEQRTELFKDLPLIVVPVGRISDLDLSRFRAAPRACLSHLTFEGDRAFPAQCRVPPPRIIEAVDVFKDCHLDLSAGFP